jgi:hypothetical protein
MRAKAWQYLYVLLLHFGMATAPLSTAAAQRFESVVHRIQGVELEFRWRADRVSSGQFLFALNDAPAMLEDKPPHRAFLLSVSSTAQIQMSKVIRSDDVRIWVTDLKATPTGYWSYALNRPRPPVWVYDLRLLDPATDSEIIPSRIYPVRDPDLDGHESVVFDGDRRIFLFYRTRTESGASYLDMEVAALSEKTGERVGHWSSKGLFSSDMKGDYLHFNSLFPMKDGRILASARATNTLYLLDLQSGRISDEISSAAWKVVDDPLHGFARQHSAYFRQNGNLVLFDNRDETEAAARSRAVEYEVDWSAKTLKMVWQHRADPILPFRFGWGSVGVLPNDNVLIGWGDYSRKRGSCDQREMVPVFTQVSRTGETIFELRAPCGWSTYRVYFLPDQPKGK